MAAKKALVTGASRGIGKAIAVRLAQGGFDVAIAARTIVDGEEREHSSSVKFSDTSPLPGSLNATADLIRQAGTEALILPIDLLDRASLRAAAETLLAKWGRIDLIVHNARFIGPGHMDSILDTPVEVLEKHVQANALAPLVLNHSLLPTMISQGGGTIIYLTSAAAFTTPPAKPGAGGWGLSYGMSKAAGHMIAGQLAVECADRGVRAFNLQPGAIKTERILQDMSRFGFGADFGEPPEVIGEVAYWLATSPDADNLIGQCVDGQTLCRERNLLPGWSASGA